MSLRKTSARRRAIRNSSAKSNRLRAIEPLEIRAMLTATPTGGEILIDGLVGRDYVTLQSADVDISAGGESVVVFEGTAGTARQTPQVQSFLSETSSAFAQEIFVQRLAEDGSAVGELVVANSITNGQQSDAVVGIAEDGSFLVVWSGRGVGDRAGIFGQRFNADGTFDGEQFRVNTERRGTQSQPALAMASDGRAVVAWHGPSVDDPSGIRAQRISADGQLEGDEFLVNSTTDDVQSHPAVGMDDEGNFVVAWSSRGQDGDAWGIFAQRFDASGNAVGDEFAGNTTTDGSQHEASVAMASLGQFAIAWSSLGQDGSSWGVFARQFDANGNSIGGEFGINEDTEGHQRDVDIAMAEAGEIFVTWSDGQQDGSGWEVAGRTYDRDGESSGDVLSINNVTDSSRENGHQQNPAVAVSLSGRGFVAFNESTADVVPSNVVLQAFDVEVGPTENVAPEFERVDDQIAAVGETLQINLRATDENIRDELTFSIDPDSPSGAVIIPGDENGEATFEWTPETEDRNLRRTFRVFVTDEEGLTDTEQFDVDVTNASPVIDLNGSAEGIDSTVDFLLSDTTIDLVTSALVVSDADQTNLESATIQLRNPLNVATENLLIDDSGTNITATYDSGRKQLTLNGSDTLENYAAVLRTLQYENTESNPAPNSRFVDITLNDGAADSSAESERATITIDVEGDNIDPTLAPISDVTVLAGSPLWIPLNGSDADGDALSFSAAVGNSDLLITEIPVGNRSVRMEVDGFGEMVFEFFENRAPRAVGRMVDLAEAGDFYPGIIFHRVINGFVIQGGDPLGTGTGGSDLGDFDDQFHVDLQHNRSGLLSMAKSTDDTNDSQFFITEGPQRSLDFNHSIFGVLVDGEDVREAISNVQTTTGDRPVTDVTIESVEVFADVENGIMMLKAPEGQIGNTTVTVTVSDGKGGTMQQTFNVEVVPDTENGAPFLDDILDQQTATGVSTTVQLTAQDVEGDSFFFLDQARLDTINEGLLPQNQIFVPARSAAAVTYSVDENTGLLTFSADSPGEYEVTVGVARELSGLNSRSAFDLQVVRFSVS